MAATQQELQAEVSLVDTVVVTTLATRADCCFLFTRRHTMPPHTHTYIYIHIYIYMPPCQFVYVCVCLQERVFSEGRMFAMILKYFVSFLLHFVISLLTCVFVY